MLKNLLKNLVFEKIVILPPEKPYIVQLRNE